MPSNDPPAPLRLTRRRALMVLAQATAAATGAGVLGCGTGGDSDEPVEQITLPSEVPPVGPGRAANNIRALMDILLPVERNSAGAVTAVGALEAGAFDLLSLDQLVPLAQAQGLLGPLPPGFAEDADILDGYLIEFLGIELDQMAAERKPLTPFFELSRGLQEEVVRDAFDEPLRRPVVEFVRGVCFLAYLGAVTNDMGLVDVGYPPFDDFDAGIAVRGYPRSTLTGQPYDLDIENLETYREWGEVDDYTFNEQPRATLDDDLSATIDETGNLR